MSFTLATLKSAVQDYLQVNETTFNNNLNTFIQEAETRIFKLVQLSEQRKNVTATTSQNNRFLATPTDFYAPFSLAIIDNGTYYYLLLKHPSFLKQYDPASSSRGRPKYYSNFDDAAFELSPVPDANYSVELHTCISLPHSLLAQKAELHCSALITRMLCCTVVWRKLPSS
jgi:hypothetical protein